MPTYEYVCKSCGNRFEKFQSMSQEVLRKCPECGGEIRRVIGTGAGIIFKGGGFYKTDYKRSSASFRTCCGREQRCDTPPCSDGGSCQRQNDV